MTTLLYFIADWWWAILAVAAIVALVIALREAAEAEHARIQAEEAERRIAAGRERAQREYERRVRAWREGGRQ